MPKFDIVDEFDPNRCQSTGKSGQCNFKALPGTSYCARHKGDQALQLLAGDRKRTYYLHKWQDRVNALTDDPNIKDLTAEIGIMRMMLEEVLNQCNDAQDLIRYQTRITIAIDKIQKLVETIDRIEARSALQPAQLAKLADKWVQVINIHVKDPEVLEQLSNQLLGVIEAEVSGA